MSVIDVHILTPEKKIWSGQAQILTAQTLSGEVGIMKGHIPLFAALTPAAAVSIITADGKRFIGAIVAGFLSVTTESISLLAQEFYWLTDKEHILSELISENDTIENLKKLAFSKAVSLSQR